MAKKTSKPPRKAPVRWTDQRERWGAGPHKDKRKKGTRKQQEDRIIERETSEED